MGAAASVSGDTGTGTVDGEGVSMRGDWAQSSHHEDTSSYKKKQQIRQAIGGTIAGIVSDMSSALAPQQSTVEQTDILFAMKALGLCKLAYCTLRDDPEADAVKDKWVEALKIEEFKCWYDGMDRRPSSKKRARAVMIADPNNMGIEAISGVMYDVSDDLMGPVPFVCFRGCVDPAHVVTRRELSDIISTSLDDKDNNNNGNRDDMDGLSNDNCCFLHKYRNLKTLCTTKHHLDAEDMDAEVVDNDCLLDLCCKRGTEFANGLLICGHSLGGAMASLFAAEIFSNFGAAISIHLITLGSPKVFSSKTATEINSCPYRNLRFCNNNDLVQSLGAPHHHPTGKNCRIQRVSSQDGGDLDNNGSERKDAMADAKDVVVPSHSLHVPHKQHEWIGMHFNMFRPKQHDQVADEISEKTAIRSHSIADHGGYFDSIFHSSTYQTALDTLYNEDIKNSYRLVHDLIDAERRYHLLHRLTT
jgi:hypothetical protein